MRAAEKRSSKRRRTARRSSARHLRQHRDRLLRAVDNAPGHAFVDDFRYRTTPKCHDRRSAGHRFDQGKAERLRPVDREKQRELRRREMPSLSPFVDLANKLHIGTVQERHDSFAEIGFVNLVHLGGDFERIVRWPAQSRSRDRRVFPGRCARGTPDSSRADLHSQHEGRSGFHDTRSP